MPAVLLVSVKDAALNHVLTPIVEAINCMVNDGMYVIAYLDDLIRTTS